MSINQYVSRIQSELNKPYEVYSVLFIEYIDYLNKIIAQNSDNTIAVNQLVMALLETRNYDSAFQTLKEAVHKKPEIQTLNNLAYFYLHEEQDLSEATKFLLKLIDLDPQSPIPYNMLGEAYIALERSCDALPPLSKAIEFEEKIEYLNNYAVALFKTGNIEKANIYFSKASKNWKSEYNSLVAYYHLGVCQGLCGNYQTALGIAEDLINLILNIDDYIDYNSIADIYYLCNEYESVVKMYKSIKLWYSIDWVSIYLYSLYKLGKKEEMELLLSKAITQCTEMIDELTPNDFESPEELSERKSEINIDIENYRKMYLNITQNNFIPQLNFVPSILFSCGLFGCIRHNIPNYLDNIQFI